MDSHTRLQATKYIWITMGIALFSLFLSAGIANGLEAGHVILGIALCIAAFLSTGTVWNWGDLPQESSSFNMDAQEKAKRERLDSVLRNLSNDDLIALKQRLSEGDIDDEMLYQHMTLSDDGEIVPIERR